MSYNLLGWMGAIDGSLSDGEFRVLFRLCWHANQQTGEIYPSLESIAAATGMHRRTVIRHVQSLEEKQYIHVERSRWPNGTQKVNRYFIKAVMTAVMPDGRSVTDEPKPMPKKPGDSSVTWTIEPGDNSGNDRVTAVSPIEEGRVNKEESPLSYGEEPPKPPENLFGEAIEAPVIELHDRVVEAWNAMVKRRPGISGIGMLSDERKKKIAARAKDVKKVQPDAWKAWSRVLAAIEANTYLCGEDPPGKGYSAPLNLTLSFMLRPAEFLKTFEGGYRANRTAETHDPVTGRRYGPAEQASREAFARVRAARAEHGDGGDPGGDQAADDAGHRQQRPLRSAFDQYGVDPTRRG